MALQNECFLKDLNAGFVANSIRVRVLHIIVDEYVCSLGEYGPFFKAVHSVDLVVVDGEGTRMVARLQSEEVKDIFLWRFCRDGCYQFCNFVVRDGGEGFHPYKKIELLPQLEVQYCNQELPDRFFNMKSISQIPQNVVLPFELFDVYGHVRYISEVRVRKEQGYEEKQLEIILETKEFHTGVRKNLICFLSGQWVDYVKRDLKRVSVDNVFVVATYVYSTWPTEIGVPTVSSYLDATEVLIDPPYPEVEALKSVVEG